MSVRAETAACDHDERQVPGRGEAGARVRGILHRVFDAMIEARWRQAERHMAGRLRPPVRIASPSTYHARGYDRLEAMGCGCPS